MPVYVVKTRETVYTKRLVEGKSVEDALKNFNDDKMIVPNSEDTYDWDGEETIAIEYDREIP